MGTVTTNVTEYKNFGKCLEIANGIVKLLVTIDVGPRVINYSFMDGENMMFEDVSRDFSESGPAFDKFGGGTWYIYGGHRLWTSPEGMPKSYYPDNEPVPYELIENGAVFKPAPQTWNQYQFEIAITLDSNSSKVGLTHKITNCAAWDVKLAPWTLTVLSPGGFEIVAQPTKDTGLLGNRLMALWPYTNMMDDRVTWGNKYIGLEQKSGHPDKFKVGINSEHGFAMYFNHGDLFIKKYSPIENGCYPDGGMSFETFTNALFLEMETLGEISSIAPGASVTHNECWSLFQEARPEGYCEKTIDALVEKYVK